jgi:hypothetical protein
MRVTSHVPRESDMRRLLRLTLLCAGLLAISCSSPEKTYYAIEKSGVTLGYVEAWTTPGDSASGEPTVVRGRMLNRLTLLGRGVDVRVDGERHEDPVTGRTIYNEITVTSAGTETGSVCRFSGDTLYYTPTPGGATDTTVLDPDVFTGDTFDFGYLVGVEPGDPDVERRYLEPLRGNVHLKRFTPVELDTLGFSEFVYECIVFDTFDETAGLASRMWVDRRSGCLIRDVSPDGASLTIADAGVRLRVQRANIDDLILAKAGVEIDDVRAIVSMKVRAKVRTAGEKVTVESLNVPGQRFVGTVDNNLIEGVFEVNHPRYDGAGAPPFPLEPDDGLDRYLRPEIAIESNDADIRAKALELTEGATDSWDAVRRIAHFVATEIEGDIPGGGSAVGTLKLRKAECGGHSRLFAALCRSVGIPARTAMGCMYTGIKGGTFGQHMWNEVYMGEAGWIPLDATAREVDYVDSGHIRLGNQTSFNPVEMEVLEYEVGPHVPDPLEEG